MLCELFPLSDDATWVISAARIDTMRVISVARIDDTRVIFLVQHDTKHINK